MNQKSKRLFNIRLYIDGIKQLKMIGIMSFIILSLEAFLVPLGTNISNKAAIEQQGITTLSTIYNLLTLHPMIVLTFFVITPLMALYLFGFLNKRNSSDFYHSIPDTRECVFVSYAASIMTWITGIILGTTAISFISTLFMKYVDLNNLSIIVVMFTVFASCVLVLGAILIAMAVSGTVFSNISVAMMILFVPRLFITVFTFSLSNLIPFVPAQLSDSIINNKYNVVLDIFSNFLINSSGPMGIQLVASGVYTLVLGLILCGIGMFAFKKRKSETATYAAVNARLQSIFRLIPAFVICLIPCTVVVEYIYGHTGYMESSTIFGVIVCYVIAIMAYFLYELITTKKWKNLFKAIPGLSVLLILNVLYVGSLYATSQVMISDVPPAESIKSIKMVDDSSQDYFKTKTESIKFTSDSMKKLVSEQLKNTVESWTKSENRGQYYRNSRMTLAIQTGNRTIYRTVSFDVEAYEQFNKEVWDTKEYKDALYSLPELGKNQTNVKLYTRSGNYLDAADIYKSYCEEIKKLSIEEYYNLISENGGMGDVGYMNVDTAVGTKNYIISLPITMALPNTLQKYIDLINSENSGNPMSDYFNTVDNIGSQPDGGTKYFSLDFDLYDTDGSQYSGSANYNEYDGVGSESTDYTKNGKKLLKEIESKLDSNSANGKLTPDKRVVKITYNAEIYGSNNKYEGTLYTKIYCIDSELFNMFLQYTGNSNR